MIQFCENCKNYIYEAPFSYCQICGEPCDYQPPFWFNQIRRAFRDDLHSEGENE